MGGRNQTGNSIHGGAEVVARALDTFTGVHGDSHPDFTVLGPRFVPDRTLQRGRREHGVRGRGERDAECVADRLEHVPGMFTYRHADELVMAGQRIAHGRAMLLPQPGRTLDVGEQQSDDARRNPGIRYWTRCLSVLLRRLQSLPIEFRALLQDGLFKGHETRRGEEADLRQFQSKSFVGAKGLRLSPASIERKHQAFTKALMEGFCEHRRFG